MPFVISSLDIISATCSCSLQTQLWVCQFPRPTHTSLEFLILLQILIIKLFSVFYFFIDWFITWYNRACSRRPTTVTLSKSCYIFPGIIFILLDFDYIVSMPMFCSSTSLDDSQSFFAEAVLQRLKGAGPLMGFHWEDWLSWVLRERRWRHWMGIVFSGELCHGNWSPFNKRASPS